jgi:hypothetical protein
MRYRLRTLLILLAVGAAIAVVRLVEVRGVASGAGATCQLTGSENYAHHRRRHGVAVEVAGVQ